MNKIKSEAKNGIIRAIRTYALLYTLPEFDEDIISFDLEMAKTFSPSALGQIKHLSLTISKELTRSIFQYINPLYAGTEERIASAKVICFYLTATVIGDKDGEKKLDNVLSKEFETGTLKNFKKISKSLSKGLHNTLNKFEFDLTMS